MGHIHTSDLELLRQYARDHSEEIFTDLVRRHIDWVYSVCRRQVRDRDLAEDVTQAVFFALARKASALSDSVSISGWLFTTARYASATALKIERRRRIHERQAAAMTHETITPDIEPYWQQIEPRLDDALARLSAADREAVILRFFRGMSHQAIGASLQISEDAAKKRVARALGRLRESLGSTAAALGDAALATLITGLATQSAPLDLANKSVAAVKTGLSGRTQRIVKGMSIMRKIATAKIVLGAVAAVLAASVTTVAIVDQHQSAGPSAAPGVVGADRGLQTIAPFDISAVQTFCVAGDANGLASTTYYHRQKGVVQHSFAPGWSATHYFLGQTEWEYRDGSALIFQKRPVQDSVAMMGQLEADLASLQSAGVTREFNSDAVIEGAQCQAYRLADGPEKFKKALVYIDPATSRPARIKTDNSLLDLTITYDPPVPDSVFTVPTSPGVSTVRVRDFLEKKYPLQGALFTKEGVGQIFAVHEAAQDASGCYHIICSSRLAADIRTALKDVADDELLGGFMMADRAGLPFHYILLAEFRESGFQVSYLLAIPKKLPRPGNLCQLPVEMGAPNVTLDAAHISHGLASNHDIHIRVNLRVALEPNSPTVLEFAGRAYDDVAPLIGLLPFEAMSRPGSGIGLSTRQDTLFEIRQKLSHYLSDEQLQ